MQVHTEQRTVMRSNLQNEHNFVIKASAKAFSILSSNLYSDKPLAIVRELCCNAYDSHVAAGKKDVPFEVVLPSKMNPTLTIRDFGTGLDHEGITKIYATFFESTKTESNDFVGQLGLGSKSPLSMFKTFTVEARKDGVQRLYSVFVNEHGIPTLAQMSETETTEPNGLAVSMHVKPDDHEKFHAAAKRALMYFDPKPIVNGLSNFVPFSVKHGVGGSNWKLRESDYWARMSGPYVVQGFVVYPIDAALIRNELDDSQLSGSARAISELNIDFWMDIGTVDVAPSREHLSYDKRTVANIAAAFERAATEMRSVIQADFDSAGSLYEAGCKLYKYENTGDWAARKMFSSMHSASPFTWKGKSVRYKYPIDVTKIHSTTIAGVSLSTVGRAIQYNFRYEPTTSDVKRTVTLRGNTVVLIDDIGVGSNSVLKQFLDHNSSDMVIVLKYKKKADYNEAEIKQILDMLGGVTAKKFTELPYKRPARTKTNVRPPEARLKFVGFPMDTRDRWGSRNRRRVFSRLTWETVEVDLSKGGYYIPVEQLRAVHNGAVQTHLDELLTAAVSLKMLDNTERVFGFTMKEVATAPAGWVNLFDHMQQQFDQMQLVPQIVEAGAVAAIDRDMDGFNRVIGGDNWNTYGPKLKDGKFKQFVEKVQAIKTRSIPKIDAAKRFVDVFGGTRMANDITSQTNAQAHKLRKEWQDVLSAYQMLNLIDWHKLYGTRERMMVIDYINATNDIN